MLEECGDLWKLPADYRCITTNGALRKNGHAIMGKGVALDARKRYHEVEAILGSLINMHGIHVFHLGYHMISFPTKYHWKQPYSDIILIKKSARELVKLLEDDPAKRILLTRPGCGNGNLHWSEVKFAIKDILVEDKFIIVHNDYFRYKNICELWEDEN